MNQINLLEAADEVGRMIDTARADIKAGHEVDISRIETKVADIYGTVSGDLHTSDSERIDLLKRLEHLLNRLDALEAELTARHDTGAGR